MQYSEFEYSVGENKITLTLLEESMGNGLMGMISSPIFKENIALVIDEEHDEEDFTFACLGCGQNGIAPRVQMTKELYGELKKETPMAKTVVMHEIGHYYNSDVGHNEDNSEEIRQILVSQNMVCQKEIKADAFAVQYLGKDEVVAGLEALKYRILIDYADYDEESVELSIREINIRISHIREMDGKKNEQGSK